MNGAERMNRALANHLEHLVLLAGLTLFAETLRLTCAAIQGTILLFTFAYFFFFSNLACFFSLAVF